MPTQPSLINKGLKNRARTVVSRIPAPTFALAVFFLSLTLAFLSRGDLIARGLTMAFLPTDTIVQPDTAKATLSPPPASDSARLAATPDLEKLEPLPPAMIDTETLWLARVIYSETKKPEEQELVAWVVRNRVETEYRGERTYKDVVLDPMQFSAFNGGRTRRFYSSLTPESRSPGWQKALSIAHVVKNAPPQARPFSVKTRHFYSEQSMVGTRHPGWARGKEVVDPRRPYDIDPERFRFIEGVY